MAEEAAFVADLRVDLGVDERLSQAASLKAKGNTAFETNQIQLALTYWHYVSHAALSGCIPQTLILHALQSGTSLLGRHQFLRNTLWLQVERRAEQDGRRPDVGRVQQHGCLLRSSVQVGQGHLCHIQDARHCTQQSQSPLPQGSILPRARSHRLGSQRHRPSSRSEARR